MINKIWLFSLTILISFLLMKHTYQRDPRLPVMLGIQAYNEDGPTDNCIVKIFPANTRSFGIDDELYIIPCKYDKEHYIDWYNMGSEFDKVIVVVRLYDEGLPIGIQREYVDLSDGISWKCIYFFNEDWNKY